jgi:hypothetical protein
MVVQLCTHSSMPVPRYLGTAVYSCTHTLRHAGLVRLQLQASWMLEDFNLEDFRILQLYPSTTAVVHVLNLVLNI